MAGAIIEYLKTRGIEGRIKKPNDVLVKGQKIAGILCETTPFPDESLLGIVLGVGLNINMPSQLLQTIEQPATSLLQEIGQETEVLIVLNAIKAAFKSSMSPYWGQL